MPLPLSSPLICEFLLASPPPPPPAAAYSSPPFLVRLFEFFSFFPPSSPRGCSCVRGEPHHGGIPIGKTPRRARNLSEDGKGRVHRKEKFVKFLAPVVISNIFVPSYSFYFYYHFLYLFRPSEMMMEEEDGGIVS